jgi:allantoicase
MPYPVLLHAAHGERRRRRKEEEEEEALPLYTVIEMSGVDVSTNFFELTFSKTVSSSISGSRSSKNFLNIY